jgi:hypothetical protein
MTEAIGAATTIKPRIPAYKREGNYEPPPAAVLNGAGKAEDLPPIINRPVAPSHPDTSSTALIQAVQKVYAVVTAQIQYHEREAARLRESLKPFATHAPRQIATPDDGSSAQAIRAVLDLADQLNLNGEQKP